MPEPYRDGVGHAVRATVLRPVMAMTRASADREGRFADAARLRAERDSLASYLIAQSSLAFENRQLRELLGFKQRTAYSFLAAETTPIAGVGPQGALRLSIGSRDGVGPEAVLVTAEGLVGKIVKLGESTSDAITWPHDQFAVAVMTTDGETYGIAKPADGPRGERMLALTPVAFHTAPDTGALVVTSGDGALFPRGIPVGKVVGQGRAEGGWQRTYYIRPNVSPAQMQHVLVLGGEVRAPSDQDLAGAWGIRLSETTVADTSARAVAPDAATPQAPARPQPRQQPARPRPRPRPVDPTPELPGRPVFPGQPRVPPGVEPPPGTGVR